MTTTSQPRSDWTSSAAASSPGAQPGRPVGQDFDLSHPLDSFMSVTRRVVVTPALFFACVRRRGNYTAPLTFGLITSAIGAMLGLLVSWAGSAGRPVWRTGWVSEPLTIHLGGFRHTWNLTALHVDGAGGALISVLAGVGGVLLVVGSVHLAVRLIAGPTQAGLEATVRTLAYASVVQLATWAPVVGGLCGLYGAYVTIIGLRAMHQTTTRAAVRVFVVGVGLAIVGALLIGLLTLAVVLVVT